MQSSGFPSNSRPTGRIRAAGAAVVVGLIGLATGGWIACSPGAISPEDCEATFGDCLPVASGQGGRGGTGGGAAGMGGAMVAGRAGGAGMGGAAGMAAAAPTAATAVAGCPKFATLGAADAFFKMRCGTGSTCHAKALDTIWGDLESPDVWKRMLNKKPVLTCLPDGKVIDTADHTKSVMYAKTIDPMQKCPNGSKADGTVMPPPMMPMYPPLTAEEKTCITAFLRAAAVK